MNKILIMLLNEPQRHELQEEMALLADQEAKLGARERELGEVRRLLQELAAKKLHGRD